MNLLTLPFVEAMILLTKMTVIFCWGTIMLSVAVRIILRAIMDELRRVDEESNV